MVLEGPLSAMSELLGGRLSHADNAMKQFVMTVSDTRQEAAVCRKSYTRVSVNHIINIPAEKMAPQEKCLNCFVEEYRLVKRNGKL